MPAAVTLRPQRAPDPSSLCHGRGDEGMDAGNLQCVGTRGPRASLERLEVTSLLGVALPGHASLDLGHAREVSLLSSACTGGGCTGAIRYFSRQGEERCLRGTPVQLGRTTEALCWLRGDRIRVTRGEKETRHGKNEHGRSEPRDSGSVGVCRETHTVAGCRCCARGMPRSAESRPMGRHLGRVARAPVLTCRSGG